MAYSQPMSPQAIHNHYRDIHSTVASPSQPRRHPSKQRFVADLSQCLFDFVIQLLPTSEEMAVKEDVRKLLERLIRTIEPDSRLLSFGSTANGFSLRNSDMDLCCLIDSDERLSAADLVTMLGDLLERETKFHVKPLPHARIPIVKLSLDPSPGLPLGIACDIGFENRLALENTRLLMCYAMIDPTRVRTMVLFLKVWSKRRKINSPYKGTLSSYGYVLLVIYYLVHVKNPAVLPNLQQMPPLRPITKEDTHLAGYNTWFFDDIELLRQRWHSDNTDTVAELLIDFFRYYSREFTYNTGVASIRAGLLKKESKGWQNDLSSGRYNDARERNRFCIEDPFELDYNVARCVTKDGLYTIRGEFMRASRVLSSRPERAIVALAELCEERKEEDLISPPPFIASRISHLPPQTPYTVGSQSMRLKGTPVAERFSPPAHFAQPGPRLSIQRVPDRPTPEHMAPKRSKWTSPPPPEAPPADHSSFETQFGKSIELATSSSAARERDAAYHSSSSNSEVLTDEDRSDAAESDDVHSVRSFTEAPTNQIPLARRPSWHQDTTGRVIATPAIKDIDVRPASNRIRISRGQDRPRDITISASQPGKSELAKRTLSRSIPSPQRRLNTPTAVDIPLPPSPESPDAGVAHVEASNVYYQTTTTRSPRPVIYPSPGSQSPFFSHFQLHNHSSNPIPCDIFPSNLPSLSSNNPRAFVGFSELDSSGPETPTPASYSSSQQLSSNTMITPPTPPPQGKYSPSMRHRPPLLANVSGGTSPVAGGNDGHEDHRPTLPASNGSSPTPSSAGYSTSISRSPSPPLPSPPPTTTHSPFHVERLDHHGGHGSQTKDLSLDSFAITNNDINSIHEVEIVNHSEVRREND